MKKLIILFLILFLVSPCYAQINDQPSSYFRRTGTIISPRTTGNSISIDSAGSVIVSGDIVYHNYPFPTGTPADNQIIKFDAALGKFAFEADVGAGGGSGTMTTVKEANAQVGDADIVALDFGAGFDLVENPDTEINIAIDPTEVEYFTNISSDVGDLKTKTIIISNDAVGWFNCSSDVTVLKPIVSNMSTDVGVLKPIVTNMSTDVGVLKTNVQIISNDMAVLTPKVTQLSADAAIWNGGSIVFTISNGTSALTTANKAWACMPYNATIISWDISIMPPGAVQLDVMTDVASGFPPIASDTNTGTFKPHVDATNSVSSDATLTGWTTALVKDEYLMVSVDSATTATQVTLSLRLKKN